MNENMFYSGKDLTFNLLTNEPFKEMGQRLMCLTGQLTKTWFVTWVTFVFALGALSRTHHNIERKPRKPSDYPSIWLL